MTIIELKSDIMHKHLSNFYIFTGEEIGIMNIYLNQISKTLNIPITRADSVLSIYGRCTSKSMFGNTVGLYVIRNDHDIMKDEKVYTDLSNKIGKNTIILLYDKIDSRLKFGKHFKDCTIQFEKLTPAVLKSYIKKCVKLSDRNMDTLINLCSGSYDLCMLEVDKIRQYMDYAKINSSNTDKVFEELLDSGCIYHPVEYDVFQFTDAVCRKDAGLSFKIEEILRNNGISSINILGTLYNSLKSVMLIQSCNGSNISETTGLDNRQIYFNKKYCGNYDTINLVKGVQLISKVVDGIKTGIIPENVATRIVLISIM